MFLRKRGKNVVIGYVQLGILKLCDAEEREREGISNPFSSRKKTSWQKYPFAGAF